MARNQHEINVSEARVFAAENLLAPKTLTLVGYCKANSFFSIVEERIYNCSIFYSTLRGLSNGKGIVPFMTFLAGKLLGTTL